MTKWDLERMARQKASSIAGRYRLVVLSTRCSRDVPPPTYRIEAVVPGTGCGLTIIGFAWERIRAEGHPRRSGTAGSSAGFDERVAGRAVPVHVSSVTAETETGEACAGDAPAPPDRE